MIKVLISQLIKIDLIIVLKNIFANILWYIKKIYLKKNKNKLFNFV